MFNKLSKLILIALMLICMAPAFASDDDARGTFVAEKDTRLYLPTPAGKLKNGKYAYFSFIVPKGFSTDECPHVRKNSKGEVLCGESEGEFFLEREEKRESGLVRKMSIFADSSYNEQNKKRSKNQSEIDIKNGISETRKLKILVDGLFPSSMKERGYYGVYIVKYGDSRRMTRDMIHYGDYCQFFSSYSEYFPSTEKEPIEVKDWLHGDAQEKLQDSFRCEELSLRDLQGFKNFKK